MKGEIARVDMNVSIVIERGLDHRFGHGATLHRRGAESAEVSQR